MPEPIGATSRRLDGLWPALCLAGSMVAQLVPYSLLGLPQTVLSDGLLGLGFLLGLITALRNRQLGALRSWPALSVLLGILLAGVSALGSPSPLLSALGLGRVIEIFLLGPLAFMLAIRRRRDLYVVLAGFSILYIVQCVYGVIQTLTKTGALIGGQPIRAVGTFGPTLIGTEATMSVSGGAIMLAGVLAYRGRPRIYFLIGLLISYAGLIASMGRSAMIAAVVVAFVLATKINLRRAIIVTLGFAIAGGLTLVYSSHSDSDLAVRVQSVVSASDGSGPDQSGIDRLSLWAASRHMIDDHPLLGLSPRQFQAHRDTYAPLALLGSSDVGESGTFKRVALLSPHNLFYLLTTEFGIPAALSILFPIVAGLIIGADRIRRAAPGNPLALLTGLAAVGLLVNVVFDGMFGDLGGPASLNIAWSLGLGAFWAANQPNMLARGRGGHTSATPWWMRDARPSKAIDEPW